MLNCTVEDISGALHFCNDGKSIGMNFPYTYAGEIKAFSENGYNVYRISLPTGWRGPGIYDYGDTDGMLQAILEEDPEARFLPLVWWSNCEEAAWWPGYCPEEQCVAADPESGEFYVKLPQVLGAAEQAKLSLKHRYHGQSPSYVSYAGKRWRAEVCEAARQFVRHIDESPFSERVIGFYVAGGHSYEWMYWGAFIWDGLCDYSQPMQRYFREWLTAKYGNDRNLSRAWHREGVCLESAALPEAPRRMAAFEQALFNPSTDQDIADFHLCTSDLVAETAIDLCAAMKNGSPNKRLCGVFYGYNYTHGGGKGFSNPQMKAHLSLNKILNASEIDFVAAPYDYAYRGVGGVHTAQGITGSVLQHKKAYISSIDLAVYGDDGGGPMAGIRPQSWDESNALLIRDFGSALCGGLNMSWVDLKGGSFRAPETRATLKQLKRIEDYCCGGNRQGLAEVALVLSSVSQAYMRYDQRLSVPLFSVQKQQGACSMGAPFDCITEEDLIGGLARQYRFYIFHNSFFHTAETRRILREILLRQDASALWIFAPGCLTPDGIDAGMAYDLCGMAMREIKSGSPLQVIPGQDSGLIYGIGIDEEFRMLHFRLEADSSDVSRAFAVVPGPDDEVLGRINGCGLPGLVLHAGQNRFDVVSSAPAVPAKLLRDFARRAGVHIYGDSGDFICAGGDFVMIYSRSSDSRILSLPGSAKSVLDLMNETEIAANTSEVPYCIPPNMTALWRIIH